MRSPTRRRAAKLAVLGLLAGMVPVLLGSTPASAGTVTTPNSCTNNAQAGTTAIPVTLSGAATPNPVTLGNDITLAGATISLDVPATVLVAGYNLGFLTVGPNNIPATVNVTLLGSNTSQGSQTLGPIAVNGTTTITDTDGTPATGDESATPLSVTAPIPTSTWT